MQLATSDRRLTADQAEALWRAWMVGRDERARDYLVLSYTPMVTYLATRKVRELPARFELDDLVSCGLIALLESIDRFDPTRGASFEQYAWTRVSGAIVDELRRQDWAPRSARRMGRDIARAEAKLQARNGATPTADEVAGELGIGVRELRSVQQDLAQADVVSLNAPARGAEETIPVEVGEIVEAPPGEHDPVLAILAGERNAKMRDAISALAEKELRVLMLVHVQELSGAQVGRMLGVSESRVSQIMSRARSKLRARLDAYEAAAAGNAA
jgi:RNA polymerase sigma factor for flagellar operon FliA